MAVAVVLCSSGWASPGASRTTSQTLHVTTRLVVVNVVAHNKKGELVEGLTQRDFTILDNGKPQQIRVFSVKRSETKRVPSKPLPPNVFSNRVARGGDVPVNVAVILLDGLDTSFGDSVFARNEVIRFLRQMPPGERIALYVLGLKGLSVIQDFTSDPSPLMEAIRGFHTSPGEGSGTFGAGAHLGAPPMSESEALDRIEADMHDRPIPTENDYRMMSSLGAVAAIAGRLSGLPGRKSLIWVTDSVPYPGEQVLRRHDVSLYRGMEQALRKAILALNQADVAVYPVDAHGLFVGPVKIGSVHGPDLAPLWLGGDWILDMDYWAKHTGGRAFYFTNGLSQAVRKALDDSKVSYTLGYYPSGVAWNGEYHRIKVLVDRKGVKVRYRRGYYATATTTNAHARPARTLETAADSPLDSTGLGVTVRLTPTGNPTSRRLKVAIYVDGRGLTFQPENSRHEVSFMVWAGQYTQQGRLLEKKARKLSFKLNGANYHAALTGGLGLVIQEAVEPGARQLRVAVLDTASGKTGSVRIPLSSLSKSRTGNHSG